MDTVKLLAHPANRAVIMHFPFTTAHHFFCEVPMQKLISSISLGALIMAALTASAQTSPSTQTQPQSQIKVDPNRLATQDEIKMMVEAKAYRPALQAIAKAFPQTNAKVPEYDKYTLLMLRAQCLLETNDPS